MESSHDRGDRPSGPHNNPHPQGGYWGQVVWFLINHPPTCVPIKIGMLRIHV